jgi:hypothetical protein
MLDNLKREVENGKYALKILCESFGTVNIRIKIIFSRIISMYNFM